MKTTDVLIIGTGIAGAAAALRLAQNPHRRIILVTREPDPEESNTRYAQGGIIHRGPDDSADQLVADILSAGAGASLPSGLPWRYPVMGGSDAGVNLWNTDDSWSGNALPRIARCHSDRQHFSMIH